jgi:polar amino acid transport system substrate-binding protein
VQARRHHGGQRQSFLVNRTVDIVVRNMTMNCARWLDWPIAFSAEYYHSGQKVLVRKGSTATSLDDLAAAKAKVCAPTGTTSLAKLQEFVAKGVVPVTADTHTGCLLHFQQAKVDDHRRRHRPGGARHPGPVCRRPAQTAITAEPYGVGFNSEDKVFVQYVNRLLETTKADGRWKASYDRWLAPSLGDAPTPPAAVYGRQ